MGKCKGHIHSNIYIYICYICVIRDGITSHHIKSCHIISCHGNFLNVKSWKGNSSTCLDILGLGHLKLPASLVSKQVRARFPRKAFLQQHHFRWCPLNGNTGNYPWMTQCLQPTQTVCLSHHHRNTAAWTLGNISPVSGWSEIIRIIPNMVCLELVECLRVCSEHSVYKSTV